MGEADKYDIREGMVLININLRRDMSTGGSMGCRGDQGWQQPPRLPLTRLALPAVCKLPADSKAINHPAACLTPVALQYVVEGGGENTNGPLEERGRHVGCGQATHDGLGPATPHARTHASCALIQHRSHAVADRRKLFV
jgi:hypothetical protein